MTWKDLIYKVHAMRTAQKEYFRTRSSEALAQSKLLEKEVDDIIQRGMRHYFSSDALEEVAERLQKIGFERL